MPAPTEVLTAGTAALYVVSHEPAATPTIKVDNLSKKSSREVVEIANVNRSTVRVKRLNPKLVFSFEGEVALSSGLGTEGPGETVATLANFAATYRDFDNAVGTLVLGDFDDKQGFIEDRPMTSFDVTHYSFVV